MSWVPCPTCDMTYEVGTELCSSCGALLPLAATPGASSVEPKPTSTESEHLTFRSGNPALGTKSFTKVSGFTGDQAMTIRGTVDKTVISLIILLISASFAWSLGVDGPLLWTLLGVGFIGSFILGLLIIFIPTWAPRATPVYAVLEGLWIGAISLLFETMFPGIVTQAILLTFAVLGVLLFAYLSGLIKPTENFKLGVISATGGILVVYIISIVGSLMGMPIPFIHDSGPIGILFSLFVVTIAALNLVLDFDFIEEGAEKGAPKYMEWYGAFGLLVTLVWLYLEILHLIAKLRFWD